MSDIKITLKDLEKLEGAVITGSKKYSPVSAVSIDSRNILPDSIFIALKGENFDGHNYLKAAVETGAKALLINKAKKSLAKGLDIPVIAVPDSIKGMGQLAAIWRKKLKTKVIAITGTVGKTTTKEMLAQILSVKYNVNRTIANYNNHIGVPLTIFSTNNSHDYLVLEMGTNHFGEIEYLAKIAQPDYALITNIEEGHLEFLDNIYGVFEEKIALMDITRKRKGKIFINMDDELLLEYGEKLKNKITFGFNEPVDTQVTIKSTGKDGKETVTILFQGKKSDYKMPIPGEGTVFNFAGAAAVALSIGLNFEEIAKGLKKVKSPDKRLNVLKLDNFILIDDTYNANFSSMFNAISLLDTIKTYKRKITILGDMLEMGEESKDFHFQIARVLHLFEIDEVYSIGDYMKFMEAEILIPVHEHFNSPESLKRFIKTKDFSKSVVLVKGSRGMKMEQYVELIKAKGI